MLFLGLATDYDGTIAKDGVVDESTLESLTRLRESGRKLLLVTGRELPQLEGVFPHLDLFDRVVAENGAVLLNPETRQKRILAERPSDRFFEELQSRGVPDLSRGDVIVATWRPHEAAVLETIRALGLDLQVIFNKDAVMILPAGVNKMTGLERALEELKLSPHNLAGIGDAENDHAFLKFMECSAAVANALPAVKERVDLVTPSDHGAGVAQFIQRILDDDLRSLGLSSEKHGVLFGRADGRDVYIDAHDSTVLLCGQSGGGKSTFVAGFVERLNERGYQVCIIDPEGDYENMEGFLTIGNEENPPSAEQVFQILEDPASALIINLIGVKMEDRPEVFAGLFQELQQRRIRQGRPHWIVIDEAHHLLPSKWAPATAEVAGQTGGLLLATVHPEHVSPAALRMVNTLAIIGKEPRKTAEEFANPTGIATPPVPESDLESGEASVWFRDSGQVIPRMQSIPGKAERKRHRRKYAEGELDPDAVFYFRGPHGKLHLKVQNLRIFLQIAAGVDEETWEHHLRCGDYSKWIAKALKDRELADAVTSIEKDKSLSAVQSREAVSKLIEEKYTAPA